MQITITLPGMRFQAYHGALSHERRIGNDFLISLEVTLPAERALKDDELNGTVNYADLYLLLKEEMGRPVDLLEHLTYRVTQQIYSTFETVDAVTIKVTKCHPPIDGFDGEGVSVTLATTRETFSA